MRWIWARCGALGRYFRTSISEPSNLPSYLLFLATIGLVVFAWYAWNESAKGTKAIQGQLTEAQRATTETNRAWLRPGTPFIQGNPTKPGDIFGIGIPYFDAGKEPAFAMKEFHEPFWPNIRLHGRTFVVATPESFPTNDTCERVNDENGTGTIWPMVIGFEGTYTLRPSGKNVLAADNDFISGEVPLGVHGCLTYFTFGKLHHTAYCFFYSPSHDAAGKLSPVGMWGWAACQGERQNWAD